ncbi:unnamed protein product, partial [Rotaria sp. Silwood2]
EPIDFAKNIVNDALHDRCSFVVHDIQTKQLVGVYRNEIKFPDDKHMINETNEKIYFNYCGYGLDSQLISAFIEYAKSINMKRIYVEETNTYLLNCFKQQGFQVYHQINYIDYDLIHLASPTNPDQNQYQLLVQVT